MPMRSRVLPGGRLWRRTLRRILVLIIPLNGPKKLAKKALFLLLVITSGHLGRWGRGRGRQRTLSHLLRGSRSGGRSGGMRSNPKKLLKEIALVSGGHFTGLAGFGAGDESRLINIGTYWSSKVIGDLIELYFNDTCGWGEGLHAVFVLRKSYGPLHKLRPDRGCGLRTL